MKKTGNDEKFLIFVVMELILKSFKASMKWMKYKHNMHHDMLLYSYNIKKSVATIKERLHHLIYKNIHQKYWKKGNEIATSPVGNIFIISSVNLLTHTNKIMNTKHKNKM